MSFSVLTKNYEEPPFSEKEILRYAGCRETDGEITALVRSCIHEARGRLTYKVCYMELPVLTDDDGCDLGAFSVRSKALAENLGGCDKAILFAATVGVEIDRLIARYGRLSPSRALIFQAIGAERIEALADAFCGDIAKEYGKALRPRFSPGYGDFSLEGQRDVFALLDCGKRIGLTLNDSLLMSPSKSVTAILGLCRGDKNIQNKCSACPSEDCTFRGTL